MGRNLGLAHCDSGNHEAAIPLQEDLLARRRRINGPESPEAIVAMMDVGNSYWNARRVDDALALRKKSLELSRKVNGPEHSDTVRALHSLAVSYPHSQALPFREEAHALSRKVNGPEHPATFRAAYNLELSYAAQGREEDRLKLLEGMLPISLKLHGPDDGFTRRTLEKLERAYYAAGRWQDAVQLKTDHVRWDLKDLNTELLTTQAWFGKEAEYLATCRRLLKFVEGTPLPTTAERAAKACLIMPVADADVLKSAHALARTAVEQGTGHQFFGWFQLALGMAEYRLGNYRAADAALLAAAKTAPINSGFFRAMSLWRQGQTGEARRLFDATVARMRPLPDDDQNPLASGASRDDMVIWLACHEAARLLGVEVNNPQPVPVWLEGLQKESAEHTNDTIKSLHLALAYLWTGKLADHEAHCRKFLIATAASQNPAAHDHAAKAYLLRTHPEPETLKLAADSARQSLALARPGDSNLPWFRTVAGAAAFRTRDYPQAETLLSQAMETPSNESQRRLALAFRAMARLQSGRRVEAQADWAELSKLNRALPDPARMSPIVRDQDQLASRLAIQEAATLFSPPASAPR